MVDAGGRVFHFHESPIPPWGHLLWRPAQLLGHLAAQTDFDTAAKMVYYVYNSPRINRLFTEDYLMHFNASRFTVDTVNAIHALEVPPPVRAELARLHPGRQHFGNNGLLALLTRPAADS
jgi:hypothetical protein